MADWVKSEYTKADIDRYGSSLIPWWTRLESEPNDLGSAYMVIQNWRSSHAMPLLTFRIGLNQRAKRIEAQPIIAQRLKRFSSVLNKLAREKTMKLSQMQDLGGCRAIMTDIRNVHRLHEVYRDSKSVSVDQASSMKTHDYITFPKADGYRGIHLVGRYSARLEKNAPWNGNRIEIQLRSRLQHAFATTVETVTTFTKSPLKFGGGTNDWRRFFSLMGSEIAHREGTPLVPGTPIARSELRSELRELNRELRVRERLRGWTGALTQLPKRSTSDATWLLLVLDVSGNTIKVTGYSDRRKAAEDLAAIEKLPASSQLDAVLVWVNSMRNLHSAYPNYYADTTAFLDALSGALK